MRHGDSRGLLLPKLAVALVTVCVGPSIRSPAEIVSFNFSGEITSTTDASNFLNGGFELGSRFTGNATVNTAFSGPDLYPADPKLGLYAFSSGAPMGQFTLTMIADEHTVVGRWSGISVHDNPRGPSGGEHLGYGAIITSYDGIALPPTFTQFSYAIGFSKTSLPFNAVATDALPIVVPVLSAFDFANITIYAANPTRGVTFNVAGLVTAVTPVPEPAMVVLLFSSLTILRMLRRGHQQKRFTRHLSSPITTQSDATLS